MTMRGPRHLGPYDDRNIDAQESAEDAFLKLVDEMEAAGWLREEALNAIRVLAINHTLAEGENEATEEAIAAEMLRRSRGEP